MPTINYKIVFHTLGLLLIFNGVFMLFPLITSLYYHETEVAFEIASAAIVSCFTGLMMMFATRKHIKNLKQKEGYLIVSLGWLFMVLSGMMPYIFTDAMPTVVDAFLKPCQAIQPQGLQF